MRRCFFNAFVGYALIGGLTMGAAAARGAGPVDAQASVGQSRLPPDVAPVLDIDACVRRLDPQLDIGYDRISARCPDLMRQLDGGAWTPWLPRGWREAGNDLSAGGLREFGEVVNRESAASGLSAGPDVRRLQPILAGLAGDRSENGWSQFKSWLRSILVRPDQPTDESWLARMVSHVGLSQSLIRLITYAALGTVVLLAGFIVVNEVRVAGFPGSRRRAAAGVLVDGRPSGAGWQEIEAAIFGDRPRLLLELIVRRLSDRGWLPPARALTVRELTRDARLPLPDDRSRLSELALAAERVRYSARPAEDLAEPIARGRELLQRLDAGGAE